MFTGIGCPAATPDGQMPVVMHTSTDGGVIPTGGMACGCVGADLTQPCPLTSNDRLLHIGCTANDVLLFIETLASPVHAHLSPFSLPCTSFQPSCTVAKLSGSVTASAYSCPTTMLYPSNTPCPKLSLTTFTEFIPQP